MTDFRFSPPPFERLESPVAPARPTWPVAPWGGRRIAHWDRTAALLPFAIVAIVFLGSRVYFYSHFKLRYEELGVDFACQTLDIELLKHDLLRSVFYLHHQVPFFNLVIGIVYKLYHREHSQAFMVLQVALGLGMALSILSILQTLGIGPVPSAVMAIVFSLWPTVVTYEWLLSYHHYGSTCLVMAVAALGRFLRTGSRRWAHAFFFLLVAVGFFRSPFGLFWILLIVGILLAFRSAPRRLVLSAAAVPVLLVLLNTIKTPLQTGRSFGYALLAPNIAIKIRDALSDSTRQRLFNDRRISPLLHVPPFFDLDGHPEYRLPLKKRGIPALDDEHKANGYTNANALQYVYIADGYVKDARWLLANEPRTYVRSVWNAISGEYFFGATDLDYIRESVPCVAMKPLQDLADKLLLRRGHALLGLALGLPVCFVYALAWLAGPVARMRSSRTTLAIVAVSVISILSASAMTLVSWGDFSRYRFDADSLYFLIFALLLRDAALAARRLAAGLLRRLLPLRTRRTADPLLG